MNPHQVTKDFERALCEYTGAPYAVAVNSCTMALLLAVKWHLIFRRPMANDLHGGPETMRASTEVQIPRRTYVSVPMSIIHAGGRPTFRDEDWKGAYQLKPLPVWDSARWFTSGLYRGTHRVVTTDRDNPHSVHQIDLKRDCAGEMVCVSFHWSKTLGIQQGGAILLDDYDAYLWLRRARFDGRTEGVPPSMDTFPQIGWHCYMSPEVAAAGLMFLSVLPKHNDPLQNDDYPDLSQMEIFK